MSEKKLLSLEIPLHPYLFDHRFEGRAVLPAVEAMQLLAVSTCSEWPDFPVNCMRNSAFDKFIYLDDFADPTATTAIHEVENDPGGSIRSRLLTRSRLKAAGLTRLKEHVSLTFARPAESVSAPIDQQPGELRGAVFSISAGQVYEELIPFGPAYRNLTGDVKLSEQGVVAQLVCPDIADSSSPLGSSFVLDAAFHAACVWGQRFAAVVAFPVGFAERTVYQPARPGRRYVSRVTPLRSEADPPVLFFDIRIATESGQPCETVRGLQMKDVSGGRWKPPPWVIGVRG